MFEATFTCRKVGAIGLLDAHVVRSKFEAPEGTPQMDLRVMAYQAAKPHYEKYEHLTLRKILQVDVAPSAP